MTSIEFFNVVQFFADDSYEIVHERVDAETAVLGFAQLIKSVGAKIGTTKRVVIVDMMDFTNMEWIYGEGITFPEEAKGKVAP